MNQSVNQLKIYNLLEYKIYLDLIFQKNCFEQFCINYANEMF